MSSLQSQTTFLVCCGFPSSPQPEFVGLFYRETFVFLTCMYSTLPLKECHNGTNIVYLTKIANFNLDASWPILCSLFQIYHVMPHGFLFRVFSKNVIDLIFLSDLFSQNI